MVCVNKYDVFAETISVTVLLCHYKRSSGRHKHSFGGSISEAALPFQKLICVQIQCSSKEAFHFFGRNLPILRRSLLIYRRNLLICSRAALQMHFGRTF